MKLPRRELLVAVGLGVGGMYLLRRTAPPGTVVEAPGLVERVLDAGDAPSSGPADAAVTMALFTDFRCPGCRRAHAQMLAAARTAGARLVYRDWPILGPESVAAARIALASPRALYADIHDRLMRAPAVDEAAALTAVTAAGGDADAARAGAGSDAVGGLLAENATLAFALGLRGTPGYLSGPVRQEGVLDEAGFIRLLEHGRREGRRQG